MKKVSTCAPTNLENRGSGFTRFRLSLNFENIIPVRSFIQKLEYLAYAGKLSMSFVFLFTSSKILCKSRSSLPGTIRNDNVNVLESNIH